MDNLNDKQRKLEESLAGVGKLLIAYSGGVDSAYLAWVAHRVLGQEMLAVIADSPSLARRHFTEAVDFARSHSLPLEILKTDEMENPDYVKNDALRCYHCKSELFTVMEGARRRLGFKSLAYGMNVDDRGDFRPGQNAAKEHAVLAPLAEAGLTKSDIRALARAAGLQVWDKPASACLSSRIEYGRPVTREVLQRIEQGEEKLRELGFQQFRVRDHGDIVRIELSPGEMEKALPFGLLATLSGVFKALGFKYVTLDCEGYRSGSMNAVLSSQMLELSHAHRLP